MIAYRLPSYADLLAAAARLRWEPDDIALTLDPALPPELVAGFVVGERAVARDLGSIAGAAPTDEAQECLETQAGDEQRHARAVSRLWTEAVGRPLGQADDACPDSLHVLFDAQLPALAAQVAAGGAPLADGIALYHGLIEGVLFLAGQDELLAHEDLAPGSRELVWRIQRDERWHVGLGIRLLVDAACSVQTADALVEAAYAALDGLAGLIRPEIREHTLTALERRLRVSALRPS